jgi:hypothetical protein
MIEQLRQLVDITLDDNLISKHHRDHLVKHGLVDRIGGWNFLTKKGAEVLIALGYLAP